MIEDVSKMRENHLVMASLLEIDPTLRIDIVGSDLVDLLVELPVDGAKFYVVTWPSRKVDTPEFAKYLDVIKENIDAIDGCPLILAWFDERQGLFIGVLVEWMFSECSINSTPQANLLNLNNKNEFFDYIRKQDTTIRILKNGELRVLKKIILNEDRNNIKCNAEMVYLRDFSHEYKMNQKPVQNARDRFYRNLNGQTQDEFPHDLLDDSILKAVKNVYPKAEVINSFLITSSEYRSLLRYRNYQKDYAEFRFLPDANSIPTELCPYLGKIEGVTIKIDIFMLIRPNKNAFANEGFVLYFPIAKWFVSLNQILKQSNRLNMVSEMIGK